MASVFVHVLPKSFVNSICAFHPVFSVLLGQSKTPLINSGLFLIGPKNPSGNMVKIDVPVKDTKTGLNGFDFQKAKFSYRTFYRPDSTCIDTFATQYITR